MAQAQTLQAGTYAVLFGSDQFGATGWADIGFNNNPTSNADIVLYSQSLGEWKTGVYSGAELAVYGTPAPVPLPAAAWLLVSGLGGLGAMMRRKGGSTPVQA